MQWLIKNFPLVCVIIFLGIQQTVNAQEVLKVYKNYALLDINQHSTIKLGAKVPLYRRHTNTKIEHIGFVQIMEYFETNCLSKVISLKRNYRVQVGDFIGKPVEPIIKKNQNNLLPFSLIGAGVLAAGGSYFLKNKANQTYNDYEAAATTADAIRLYDKTESLDKKSQIIFGVASGLVITGIITYLINHSAKPQASKSN